MFSRIVAIVLSALTFSAMALANEGKAVIKDISSDGNQVTLKMPKGVGFKPGGDITLVDDSGNTCRAGVLSTAQGGEAVVSSFGCKFAASLSQGDKILVTDEFRVGSHEKSSATSESNDFVANGLGFSLGYSFADHFDVSFSSPFAASGSVNAAGAFNFGARFAHIPADGLGFIGAMSYETSRTITGGTGFFSTAAGNIALILFEPAITYSMSHAYLFGGIDYSVPIASSLPSGETISSGLGVEAGLGYGFSQHLAGEFGYRTVNFGLSQSGGSADYTRLWGVTAKLIFLLD